MTQAPIRHDGRLTVALISEVFWEADGVARLEDRLDEAVRHGADLALLPEIPLNPWSPATKNQRDDDAEPMDGPRAAAQAKAAARAGIGLVGGIIHRDPTTGRRTQRTLVLDSRGQLVATYEKLHLPDEPGFWEPAHYDPGTAPPSRIDDFGLKVGIQVCSDANRPEGTHLLGGMGAEAVLIPRSTEEATYQRWKTVFQANARTSAMYVLSVNRPYPEQGILIGGPSVAVDPHGTVMTETNDRMAIVTLDRSEVENARTLYPGYLPVRARLYADTWAAIADASETTAGTRD